MGLVKMYLLAYNVACALGWAYTLFLLATAKEGEDKWELIRQPVLAVQTAAVLEIVHSLVGFVRSPVMTVFMQVASRVIVYWGATVLAPEAQQHWSMVLMVASHCLVEVPRYLFYAANLFLSGTAMPYGLFWLRYSLFIVLYPSGISGELFQFWYALPHLAATVPAWYRFVVSLMCFYSFAGPFMVLNMWKIRKSQFRKRQQLSNPRPLSGLVWPKTKKGDRGTTETNREVLAAGTAGADAEAGKKCRGERSWRFGYAKHVDRQVRLSLESRENALAIARAGLARAHELFEFVRNESGDKAQQAAAEAAALPLKDAMAAHKGTFATHRIDGDLAKPKGGFELEVPYGMAGKPSGRPYYEGKAALKRGGDEATLTGAELEAQLKQWTEYGTIEPSAAEAIRRVASEPEWLDLSDRYFVLLGATSAMGPLEILLKHGANVIAVDLDRDFIWSKLFKAVRNSCGSLTFPVPAGTDCKGMDDAALSKVAGSNLLDKTPEIANWLTTVYPDEALVCGNYTYLDGGLHVQLALACDAIMETLCRERQQPTSLCFLCTPTDCLLRPASGYLRYLNLRAT